MNKTSRVFRGLVGLSVLVGTYAIVVTTGWLTTTYLPSFYGNDVGTGLWTYTKNGSMFLILACVLIVILCMFGVIFWKGLQQFWSFLIDLGGDIIGYKEPVIETPETELTEVVEH